MRWLLCLIGSTRVSVPTDAIRHIVEYEVGPPPPLTSPYLAGIGVLTDELVLSVRVGFRPTARTRRTKGLLLSAKAGALGWAFEIDQVVGLVNDGPRESLQSEPAWLLRTRSGDRFLEVPTMLQMLGGA
ncbi:MAG: hypothetical protein IPI49_25950 [Myxococcales bacterium]|jgi:hypothetical protein|nr:hypothetical protein [Myxococcales bacterium]